MTEQASESILGIAIRDVGRLRTITSKVVRHGFGELLNRSALGGNRKLLPEDTESGDTSEPAAKRFKQLLEELGPTFIKLGQILSMRPDILPEEYITALQELQDNTPVLPFEQIRGVVEDGLGKTLDELFADFDEKPLATASIAQTHLATTKKGDRVVVKVQRPGIEKVMRADLNLLYIGAKALESTIDEMSLLGPSEVVAEFEKGLLQELNFANELNNLLTAKAFLDPDRRVTVPEPYAELSCKTVLTMGFFAGKPIRHLTAGTPEAKAAVEEIIHASAKQVFFDGFFHGDPHSGNILIDDNGDLCMIDLGLMGRLSVEQRKDMVTLIIATITNDSTTIANILLKMGTPTQRVNLSELKAEITRIRSKHLVVDKFGDYDSSAFVQEFVDAANKFRIKLAPEYALLTKAAATIEGIMKLLDPEADLIGIARPYAERIVAERFSPTQVLNTAMGEVAGMGHRLSALPDLLDQVMHDMEMGTLQFRAVTPELDNVPRFLDKLSNRIALAFFATAMSMCGSVLLASGPTLGSQKFFTWFCIILAFISWFLLLFAGMIGPGKAVRITPLIKMFKR